MEFMKIIEHFTLEEVEKEPGQELPEDTRYLAILAALVGCQGLDVYKDMLPKEMDGDLHLSWRKRWSIRRWITLDLAGACRFYLLPMLF